ncbi:hypothetical protein ACU635_58530 [[Actinomadura] parvosata]|uniref:hypothetical protein n=1 Tax=[Actinomadura] parvosata TaxID=1955412 RepID=UPI00406CB1C5
MSSHEPFDAIESELTALGDLLDVPAAPPPADVAAAVRARLEADAPADVRARPESDAHASARGRPGPASREDEPVRPSRRRRRTRWAVVAAVVVAVITVTAATPQGRAAVERILRFAGIEIEVGRTTPPPVTTTTTGLPGEHEVSRADLPAQVKFPVRAPAALGEPRRVTVSENGRVASMFWPGGIRLDQFDGTMAPFFFKKLGPPAPEYTRVNGREAWWIPGEHPLGYIPREDGTQVPLRQAAATLIWQQDGVNFRLEGAGSIKEAVRIASSIT